MNAAWLEDLIIRAIAWTAALTFPAGLLAGAAVWHHLYTRREKKSRRAGTRTGSYGVTTHYYQHH